MGCIYSKRERRNFIDSGLKAPAHNKKYDIYHRRIQRKKHRFHQDYYWVDNEKGFKEVGINKEDSKANYNDWSDWAKDTNTG
jgi:hypothetical protein